MKIVIANYELVDEASAKFWRSFTFNSGAWIAQWGRINTDGQFKLHHADPSFRRSIVQDKQHEKLTKGYRFTGSKICDHAGVDPEVLNAAQLSSLWRNGRLLPTQTDLSYAVRDLQKIREGLA